MATPKFDPNMWYQLTMGDTKQSYLGTVLFANSGTRGATYFNTTDTSSKSQQWQVFQLNSTTWVLRTAEAGPSAYMGTTFSSEETTQGKTRPTMLRGDVADASAFWTFESWGDGTYFLTNAANGTDYHLNRKENSLMAMSPNITAPQNGQRWQFKEIDAIDDKKWSAVDVCALSCPPSDTTCRHTNICVAKGSNNSHIEHLRIRINNIYAVLLNELTFKPQRKQYLIFRRPLQWRKSSHRRIDRRCRPHRVDCVGSLYVEKAEATEAICRCGRVTTIRE